MLVERTPYGKQGIKPEAFVNFPLLCATAFRSALEFAANRSARCSLPPGRIDHQPEHHGYHVVPISRVRRLKRQRIQGSAAQDAWPVDWPLASMRFGIQRTIAPPL